MTLLLSSIPTALCCPVSGEPLHGGNRDRTPAVITASTAARRRSRQVLSKAKSLHCPISIALDRHRFRTRGTPKMAFRWDTKTHAHYATAWANRFLPLACWHGPYRSVYLARKALEGVIPQ